MFFIFVFNSGGWECPDPLTAKGGGASYNLHHSESRHPPIDAIISFFFSRFTSYSLSERLSQKSRNPNFIRDTEHNVTKSTLIFRYLSFPFPR